jgi:hypothetical protein
MYFAGMQRTAIQISDGSVPGARLYDAVYEMKSVPARSTVVLVEQFPNAQSAAEHFGDLFHAER